MKKFLLIALSLIVLMTDAQPQTNQKQDQPNILFLFADDWGKFASIYHEVCGDKAVNALIQTPNVDRIGLEGALFTNAHVPAPSCTPCRSSILSGQYFYRTGMGAILQAAEWDSQIPTFPLLLEKNGYHTGYTYKVWSPGSPIDAPYGGAEKGFHTAGRKFRSFSFIVGKAENKEAAKEELLNEVRQNFRSFLDANKTNKPFCYWFGPTNTHRSWLKGSGKDIWGLDPANLKGKMPDYLPDVPEIREDFNDYLGEVLAWDEGVGVILDELKKSGEYENTFIVISGDHGIPGFPKAKTNLYSAGTEVALAMSWPGVINEGRVVTDFINLMDLAPTFLAAAGVPIPDVMTGKNLLPVITSNRSGRIEKSNNYVVTGWERHVATAREGNLPYPSRAIRTDEYLYIRNFKPDRWPVGPLERALRDIDAGPTKTWYVQNWENKDYLKEREIAFGKRPYEELYLIKEDPYEMENLADVREYFETKQRLSELLDSVLIATNDPRMSAGPCIFESLPYTKASEGLILDQKRNEEEIIRLMQDE